jgi:lipopolysaccharide biosynthesis protein
MQHDVKKYRNHINSLYKVIEEKNVLINKQAALLEEAHRHLDIFNSSPHIRFGKLISMIFSTITNRNVSNPNLNTNDMPQIDKILILPYQLNNSCPIDPNIAVILHVYYIDQISEFRYYLNNIPWNFSLYISTDTEEKMIALKSSFEGWSKGPLIIEVFPNKGRDIAPKFFGFRLAHIQHDFVLHLHTKKSPYAPEQELWRDEILSSLVGSEEIVKSIINLFDKVPNLGVVSPRKHFHIRNSMKWNNNLEKCQVLGKMMGLEINHNSPLDFPAGSMFWARSKALNKIISLDISIDSFEDSNLEKDGQLAHAIERLIFYGAELDKFICIHVASGEFFQEFPYEQLFRVNDANKLDRLIDELNNPLIAQDSTTINEF